MKRLGCLLFIIYILSACSSYETGSLQIRIGNKSPFNFTNIKVNTSGNTVNFDDLKSGIYSEYKIFDLAYKYAFIQLEINSETYTLQPIDFVGETPLENGNYTYEIDIDLDSQFHQIILTLKTD